MRQITIVATNSSIMIGLRGKVISMNRCIRPHELVQTRSAEGEVSTGDMCDSELAVVSSGRNCLCIVCERQTRGNKGKAHNCKWAETGMGRTRQDRGLSFVRAGDYRITSSVETLECQPHRHRLLTAPQSTALIDAV